MIRNIKIFEKSSIEDNEHRLLLNIVPIYSNKTNKTLEQKPWF